MVGEIHVRPPGVFDNLVWEILDKCWSKTPQKRPQIAEVHHVLESHPKITYTPRGQSVVGEFTVKLQLHIHSIKFSNSQ